MQTDCLVSEHETAVVVVTRQTVYMSSRPDQDSADAANVYNSHADGWVITICLHGCHGVRAPHRRKKRLTEALAGGRRRSLSRRLGRGCSRSDGSRLSRGPVFGLTPFGRQDLQCTPARREVGSARPVMVSWLSRGYTAARPNSATA